MKYEDAWIRDGSFRDIYILGTTVAEWQRVIDFLRDGHFPVIYKIDSAEAPLAHDLFRLFTGTREHLHLMGIESKGVNIHCHFFDEDRIEFDIDPRQIESDSNEDGVLDFMKAIGDDLGWEIILTMENSPGEVILRYLPSSGRFEYMPPEWPIGPWRQLTPDEIAPIREMLLRQLRDEA